jgi:hypothetical protein
MAEVTANSDQATVRSQSRERSVDVCPTFVNKCETTWRPLAHAACTPDLQVYEAVYLTARTQEADGYPVSGRQRDHTIHSYG